MRCSAGCSSIINRDDVNLSIKYLFSTINVNRHVDMRFLPLKTVLLASIVKIQATSSSSYHHILCLSPYSQLVLTRRQKRREEWTDVTLTQNPILEDECDNRGVLGFGCHTLLILLHSTRGV